MPDWSTSDLTWLRGDESGWRAKQSGAQSARVFADGLQRGAEQKERASIMAEREALFPLKMMEAQTAIKAREAQLTGEILQNQQQQNSIEDSTIFRAAQEAYLQNPNMPDPVFKTPAAASSWRNFRASSEFGKAAASDIADFRSRLSKLDGKGRASVIAVEAMPNGLPSAEQWEVLDLHEKRVAAEAGERSFALKKKELELKTGEELKVLTEKQKGDKEVAQIRATASLENTSKRLSAMAAKTLNQDERKLLEKRFQVLVRNDEGLSVDEIQGKMLDVFEEYQGRIGSAKPAASTAAKKFDSPESVRAAVAAGKLSKTDAAKILREEFKFE